MTLQDFTSWLEREAPWGHDAAIDLNHAFLLFAVAVASKSQRMLNLGIGPGLSVNALLRAVRYTGAGSIVAVDNNYDLGGNMSQGIIDQLRNDGVEVVISEERDYVFNCPTDSFDLIVSDADHYHAGEWVDEILRIARPGAFIFVHDADNSAFPGLRRYQTRAAELGLGHVLFNKGGRGSERAPKTGWLMIVNRK